MRNPPAQAAKTWRDTIPGLTTGVLDDAGLSQATGLLFPQPWVSGVGGNQVRLDDLLGNEWMLIAQNTSVVPDDSDIPVLVAGQDFVDETGTLGQWFKAFDADAVLLRPDRYVFGVASVPLETQLLIEARAVALAQAGVTPEVVVK